MNIPKLTAEEEIEIEKARQIIFAKLNSVPPEGIEVDYLDKKFKVLPGVFWPHHDSKEIVQNMVINKGESVLDLFTGSGVIGIHAALSDASRVVAVDINPTAVECAKINADRFGVADIFEARVSDVFSAVRDDEKFDVIVGNPPFSNKKVSDESQRFIEQTIKDEGFAVQTKLFEGLAGHLKPGGRAYFSQANFGGAKEMLDLAEKKGFEYKLIGTKAMDGDPRIFYAFEFKRHS